MENEKNFKTLEQKCLEKALEYGRMVMKESLEELDNELRANRNKKEYRHRGKKEKTICTVLGNITLKRNCYANNVGKRVFLLDDYLGLQKGSSASPMLCEHIANLICSNSYRTTADEISNLTGSNISHGTVWNIVQDMGDKADRLETQDSNRAKNDEGTGEIVTKVLFEEQDGIYLKLQGKDRKQYGNSKEMKVAIAYDGWQKTEKNRYNVTNKIAVASFETVEQFYQRKEGAISSHYNTNEIELRILNADGAEWVKRSITGEEVIYQLDPFHRNKAILEKADNPEVRKQMMKLLYEKKIDELLEYIEAMSNSTEDEKQAEKYRELLTYFKNNKEALIAYKRRDIEIPEAPEGKTYRQLGTMESNIFSLIGNRMKGRRACWSIDGGNHLAKLLTLKSTKQLGDKIDLLTSTVSTKMDEIKEVKMSAGKIPQKVGKGYNGIPTAQIPDMKWAKSIFGLKPLSEL